MLNKIIYTILGIGTALVFYPHPAVDTGKKLTIAGISTQNIATAKAAPEMAANEPAPALTAKAALAVDLDSKAILYSKNLDEKLPIASLTKLMTALIIVKHADPNSVVTVGKNDQNVVGSSIGLVLGERITVGSLLQALLISSSNDSALALGDSEAGSSEKFAVLMNQQAQSMGLTNSHFANPVGWDSDENYSNTLDLMKIVEEVLKYDQLKQIAKTKQTVITSIDGQYTHELHTTNKLLLDNPEVEGLKTGFTSKALGNLIILVNHNDSKIVTIVLGSDNREEDTKKLLDWLLRVYRW